MDFRRTDGKNKDFIENCKLLDIDLDRRVGKKIKYARIVVYGKGFRNMMGGGHDI